jgi:protein-disulfide isomerase
VKSQPLTEQEIRLMISRIRSLSTVLAAAGVLFVLGPQTAALAQPPAPTQAPAPVPAQKNAQVSVGDDPSMKEGSPDLVLIEMSDFQCPYCAKGASDVVAKLHENYVKTGKLELIFLDLPLEMHPHAFKAAEAASCAGDQKKFWEMHDLLFANQKALAPEQLPTYAKDLGLDVAVFEQCLSSGQHAEAIREDMKVAESLRISGTPAYLLGRRIPGGDKVEILYSMKGLPPYEFVENKINEHLTAKPQ